MNRYNSILAYLNRGIGWIYPEKKLATEYGEKYIREAENVIAVLNLKRLIPLTAFIGIFQIVFPVMDIYNGFYNSIGELKYVNIFSAVYLLVCCVVFAVGIKYLLKRNADVKPMRALYRSFYAAISIGMMLYIYSDLKRGDISNTIYYLAIIYAIFPILTSKESLFFITFNTVGVMSLVYFSPVSTLHTNNQVLFILMASWIVMLYLRSIFISNTFNQLKLKDLNRELEYLSKIDPLTCLENRRGLNEYVEDKIQYWKTNSTNVIVMMIDVDNFKNYNDTFSHLDGDDCLNAIVGAIKSTLIKEEDIISFLARVGGEEFTLIIEGWKDKAHIKKICVKIKDSVEKMHMVAGNGSLHEYVTVSIGASILSFSQAGSDNATGAMEAQYRLADYELYNAKKLGKNRISLEGELFT